MASKPEHPARDKGNTRGPKRSHLKDLWLKEFPKYGTIQATCVKFSIDRKTVYKWLEDPEFAAEFVDAEKTLLETYENSAQHRGVQGVERFVMHNGKPVIDPRDPEGKKFLTYREFSDHCLEMLMAAKDPARYGRRNNLEIKIDVTMINEVLSDVLTVIRRNTPDACPNCKTVLGITPKIADEMGKLSKRFEAAKS